jgi:hypothetical protein
LDRTKRIGRVGGLATVAVAATPFAFLWAQMVRTADVPPPAQVRLDMAVWLAVLGTPAMVAAWLLWRAWWRQAGARLSSLDGPGWLLAAATATLPADRRDWGEAMAAELTQVRGPAARWRFAIGCARTAAFPPGGNRTAVGAAAALAVAAVAVATLATGVRPARGAGVRARLRRAARHPGHAGGGAFAPDRPGRAWPDGRRPEPARHP